MAKICGKGGFVAVMSGATVNTVAEITQWSMSGINTPIAQKDAAFGDTCADFCNAGPPNPGTISAQGNYDPTDTNGRIAIETLCISGAAATGIRFYDTATSYWTCDTANGGSAFVTSARTVNLPRNGIGSWSFEAQVTDAPMLYVKL